MSPRGGAAFENALRAESQGTGCEATPNSAFTQMHNLCRISSFTMPCEEAMRLRAEYDVALRGRGKTLFLTVPGLDTESKLKAVLLRLAALEARTEAASRLVCHLQACAICRRDIN
jgi:hypothetical protein